MQGECESCGIVEKGEEHEAIIPYRGHNICGHCVLEWNKRERRAKYSISFDEFKEGKKPKSKGLTRGNKKEV